MKQFIALFFTLLLLSSCGNKKEGQTEVASETYNVEFAKGFTIKKFDNYVQVTVTDPWDSTSMLRKYILVDKKAELPANLPQGILVRTPLENVAVYSTIHCTVLNELDLLGIIKGVCEPEYVDIDYIQTGIKNGSIADLGLAGSPNIEKIIMLDPEAIMATPIEGQTYGSIEKTKIPIIETPDYMEATPLGRAEWVKFYSVFLGKEELADSLFKATVRNYDAVKSKIAGVKERPTVFTDRKYGNVWYMPGGKSYMSNMFKDAGATYIWETDNDRTGSLPLPFETILDRAGDAQFWLIKYNQPTQMTYNQLEEEFKPYSYFGAFKNRNIWGCNSGVVPYYEDLPIHPDYILQELAYIFHPELFTDYQPRYYRRLNE